MAYKMKLWAKDDAGRTFWKPTEILKSTLYWLKVQEGDMLMSHVYLTVESDYTWSTEVTLNLLVAVSD